MRKIVSFILSVVISMMSVSTAVFADNAAEAAVLTPAEKSATALNSLNLFKGTGEGFELDREATRMEAVVTIIRLLGQEDEALNCTYSHPFTDVPLWADRYAAYAYEKGIVGGVSYTEFGYSTRASVQQFSALLLRALGYSENNGDFSYVAAAEAGRSFGLIDENVGSEVFLRSDMVIMAYNALAVKINGTDKILSEKLLADGIFDAETLAKVSDIMGTKKDETAVNGGESSSNSGSSGSSGSSGNSGSSSSSGKPTNDRTPADIAKLKAMLPQLIESNNDYHDELSKVIVLVDSEELWAQYEEATGRLEACNAKDISKLTDSGVEELYDELTALFGDMEAIAIQVAIER